MPKIVITGGAGFIGSHIAEHSANVGHEIVEIDDYYSSDLKKIVKTKHELIGYEQSRGGTVMDTGNGNLLSVNDLPKNLKVILESFPEIKYTDMQKGDAAHTHTNVGEKVGGINQVLTLKRIWRGLWSGFNATRPQYQGNKIIKSVD